MAFPGVAEFPDRQTLRLIRHVNAEPVKVWDAVTVADQMKDWFYPANFNPAADRAAEGLKFDFEIGWTGHVEKIEEGRFITYKSDEGGWLDWEIEATDYGSRIIQTDHLPTDFVEPGSGWAYLGMDPDLVAKQYGGPGSHWLGVVVSWHGIADNLAAYVSGETVGSPSSLLFKLYDDYLSNFWSK